MGARCTRTCDRLLRLGAQLNASNCLGVTPFHMAVTGGHIDTMEVLLEWGVDIEEANLDGWTALHYAAQAGDDKAVALLLQQGARADACSVLDETPLEKALRFMDSGGEGGSHGKCYQMMAQKVFHANTMQSVYNVSTMQGRTRAELQDDFAAVQRQRWINRDILAGRFLSR